MTTGQPADLLRMSNRDSASGATDRATPGRGRVWTSARPFVTATIVVAVAAGIAPLLQRLPHANLSLLFLTGVLIVAVRHGLWPSIYASLLSFFVFTFFFTSPYMTLTIREEGDVATLVFFLVMAAITGNLASRLRDAMAKREAAINRTALLQELTRLVAGAATEVDVLQILADRLADNFGQSVVALATEGSAGGTAIAHGKDESAGRQPDWNEVLKHGSNPEGWTVLPITTVRGRVGIAAIPLAVLTRDERRYADALIDQAAVALERTLLVKDLEAAKIVSEREQLRSALLTSVSHDLRTPLSSIIGAASSLLAYEPSFSAKDKNILLQSVLDESERLDRYIQNLLDMMRLGQGRLELHRDWEDVRDLVSAASRRLRLGARGMGLATDIADDAELIYVHGDLIEQVLVNLFDNAVQHSPHGGRINVRARRDNDDVVIDISDQGPGIPEADRERVFDPFYRVHERDRKSGTGLGLSICRGILRAHGGDASALPPEGGIGALLRLRISEAKVPEHPQ